jgi:hypothetical protein
MTLFAPDLYRNFLIGFIGGGLILAANSFDTLPAPSSSFVTQAQAATPAQPVAADIDIAEEFVIAPEVKPAP